MKIAFVLPEIGPGGAERVATLLAGEWQQAGHLVTLLTLDDGANIPSRRECGTAPWHCSNPATEQSMRFSPISAA